LEQRNHMVIAITVTLLMFIALSISFGRNLFTGNTPQIVLPPDSSSESASGSGSSDPDPHNQFLRVEVTPGTVQSVIASLTRNTSYYRELVVKNHWSEAEVTTTNVQVWVDSGWSHIVQTLPTGLIRHDLIGDGQVYYWYEGEDEWRTAPADDLSADIAQHIPTYETVLALEPESITATGYELQEGLPCIYVQVQQTLDGYEERYWVSVDSGLLVRAETLEHGTLIYAMTAFTPIQSPGPILEDTFALPDGTALHTSQAS